MVTTNLTPSLSLCRNSFTRFRASFLPQVIYIYLAQQDMARGLEELVSYEGDVENDFGISFQASKQEFGIVRHHILKSSGDKIPVTNSNRKEYVQCFLNWILNKAVYRCLANFIKSLEPVVWIFYAKLRVISNHTWAVSGNDQISTSKLCIMTRHCLFKISTISCTVWVTIVTLFSLLSFQPQVVWMKLRKLKFL